MTNHNRFGYLCNVHNVSDAKASTIYHFLYAELYKYHAYIFQILTKIMKVKYLGVMIFPQNKEICFTVFVSFLIFFGNLAKFSEISQ